jgi:hypothetical protein
MCGERMSSKMMTCVGGENEGKEITFNVNRPTYSIPLMPKELNFYDTSAMTDTTPIMHETYRVEKYRTQRKTTYVLVHESLTNDEALKRIVGLQLFEL